MTTLLCARCGARIAEVHDVRFGALPTSSLCLRCSHPAYMRRLRRV